MASNYPIAAEHVLVIIPNGVFGATAQYKNHDPQRIKHVHITKEYVQLHMDKKDHAQAIVEFETYLLHFQQQIDSEYKELQYDAYERVEYDQHYAHICFYLTAEQYFQHRFLEMNELELVIDALHYQLYKGLTPSVTFQYIDSETQLELGKISYP